MVNVPVFEDDWVSQNNLPDNSVSLKAVVLISLFSIVFVFSAILNTIFLVFYLRKSSLRNVSNKFICNLCVCNVVKAFVILPIIIVDAVIYQSHGHSITTSVSEYLCSAFNVATDAIISEAIFSTALIAADRYFAITDPLHYYMTMTKHRSLILILLSWAVAVLVGVLSFFSKQANNTWNVCQFQAKTSVAWESLSYASMSLLFCFVIPFIAILWAYTKIYLAAQQNSERTRRSSVCNSPESLVVDLQKFASRSPSTRSASSHIVSNIRRRLSNASLFLYKEEARTAKISVAVVILFLICFIPFYYLKFTSAVMTWEPSAGNAYKVGILFSYLNAMLSPYLYVFRSKQVKKELYKRLGISGYDYEMRKPPYRQINLSMEHPSLSNSYVDKIIPFGKEDLDKNILLSSLLTKSMLEPASARTSFAMSSTSSGSTTSSTSSQQLHGESLCDKTLPHIDV